MDKNVKFRHFVLKQTERAQIKQQSLVYNIKQIFNPDLIAVRDKNMKFNGEK